MFYMMHHGVSVFIKRFNAINIGVFFLSDLWKYNTFQVEKFCGLITTLTEIQFAKQQIHIAEI